MKTYAQAFTQYLALKGKGRTDMLSPLLQAINAMGFDALEGKAAAYRRDPMGVDGSHPDQLVAPDYGVNLARVNIPVDAAEAFRCHIPKLGSLLALVANDTYHPTDSLQANQPSGLSITSLNNVPEQDWDAVKECVAQSIEDGGASAALNAALLCDGIFISTEKDANIEKPLQIVSLANPSMAMLNDRRIVILARENSHVRILLCDHTQNSTHRHLNLQNIDVLVEAGANVELYDIEEGAGATSRLWQVNARQADNSTLSVSTISLHGGVSRNEYNINVDGSYCTTRLNGLAICSDNQIANNIVTLRHKSQHSTSRQLFKNAMFDSSRGGFGGKIIVEQGATFTDAAQTNRNLLIGDDARMTAAPQLEIYCDEVKCSHGATTGQLDQQAIFYMQSRGVPYDEARKMLTQAFMVDVVDSISMEILRQRIAMMVEKRLNGDDSCDSCASDCHIN